MAIGSLQSTGYVIGDNRIKRLVVAIVSMNLRGLWTLLQWGRGSITKSCAVCTYTLNLQWRQPHSSTRKATYGESQSAGKSFQWQTNTEGRPWREESNSNYSKREATSISTRTPTHTWLHEHPPPSTPPWAHVFPMEMMINTPALFVERKSTSPWTSVFNCDTNSTTHNCDWKAAYGK